MAKSCAEVLALPSEKQGRAAAAAMKSYASMKPKPAALQGYEYLQD